MKKFIPLLVGISLLGFSPEASALYGNFEEFEVEETQISPPTIIPKKTFFRGFIAQTISSEFNNSGDIVKVLITADFTINDTVILPKNSLFIGEIKNLEKAQQGMDGHFEIPINTVVFPNGKKYVAKGYIVSAKNKRIFGGNFSKRSGHKTVLHRSECFGPKGVLQLMQNGPRKIGEETKIKMGEMVTIVLEEDINHQQERERRT